MKVLDPVAAVASPGEVKARHLLDTLKGKRIGFLWSQHVSSTKFWPAMERAVARTYQPTEIHRLYKRSTWNAATPAELEELGRKVDWAIVGVGG